jgi:sporulation protein YlmC with PRC-barrel domain
MKPNGPLKLVGQLLDLPVVDKDDRWCGIVDDVEFTGSPGKEARIKALLVGPGAYKGRMPGWMYWLVSQIAGDRIVRVPLEQIGSIGSAVHLKCPAKKVGLNTVENKVGSWIPRKGAM